MYLCQYCIVTGYVVCDYVDIVLQLGDLQTSYGAIRRSVEAFPAHADSNELFKILKQHFSML